MAHPNPPTMYILTGISFAGKSILAARLTERLGIARIDPDAVAHELGWGLAGEFLSDEQWSRVHREAERRAREALRAGRSLVYDTTSFTREQRDALRDLATAYGAAPVLIFVDTQRAEAHARWCRNEATRQRFRVHPDDFAMVADRFEPPLAEPHIRFGPEDDVEDWIRHFLKRR